MLTRVDQVDLAYAKALLESQSLASRVTDFIGKPIEKGIDLLPADWSGWVGEASRRAITRAVDVALATIGGNEPRRAREAMHKLAVAVTGASGGYFGLAALGVELPISTVVMLRSILDIARSEGERIDDVGVRLACVEVFALGGPGAGDDAAETGYFAVRAVLARAVSEAAEHVAKRGLAREGAPAVVRMIAQVAQRFGLVVSEKAAAQAIPVVGALGGAGINTLFIDHFQDVARGHFIVRRLERIYGTHLVREAYEQI
jgi:hypothetical protein